MGPFTEKLLSARLGSTNRAFISKLMFAVCVRSMVVKPQNSLSDRRGTFCINDNCAGRIPEVSKETAIIIQLFIFSPENPLLALCKRVSLIADLMHRHSLKKKRLTHTWQTFILPHMKL